MTSSDQTAATTPSQRGFLHWFPWEKLIIWGLFLLAVYVLRHFFFIIFMTFILTYIMRSVIVRIVRLVSSRPEVPWLERVLALVCFALFLLGLYGGVSYLGPPLKAQFEGLVQRARELDPEKELERLGARTVGAYLVNRKYPGGQQDPQYEKDFEVFCQLPERITAFEEFAEFSRQIEMNFDEKFDRAQKEEIRRQVQEAQVEPPDSEFEEWFVGDGGPAQKIFEKDPEGETKNWEARAAIYIDEEELRQKSQDPAWKQRMIRREILLGVKEDPAELERHRARWKKFLAERQEEEVDREWQAFFGSPEYTDRRLAAFRAHYEQKADAFPVAAPCPYAFDRYLSLKAAYDQGKEAFSRELGDEAEVTDEDLRKDFELYQQEQEFGRWMRDEPAAAQLREAAKKFGDELVSQVPAKIVGGVQLLVSLPVKIGLALLLSFFITFDIPKIRRGVRKLRNSRISGFYEEIAPGLANFGHLIGRAFQAQGVIALFNTLLTFIAIRWLGIQNEMFLCAIVFFCSFIPVLGVVLSSVPICAMAIIQPGGTVWMALQAALAIVVIHFIETSVLNPKILGDMLHLHPVMVLTVLAVGEHFFGVWGLLLGVPVCVYIIRFVLLDEGIPGLIPATSRVAARGASASSPPGRSASSDAPAAPAAGGEPSAGSRDDGAPSSPEDRKETETTSARSEEVTS